MLHKKPQSKLCWQLSEKARIIRRKILDMALNAGSGHIASAFSCVEILVSLYHGGILRVKPGNAAYRKRDRFVLSKGHAAIALYAVLADLGFFPNSRLDKFGKEGGHLGVHPELNTPGIDVLSGSLGHGLSVGSGLALGARLDNEKYVTVVLLGDGECQEGMIWEAALFSSQHNLNNLIVVIDYNKLSATDFLKKGLSAQALSKKWEAFGWQSIIVEGNSFEKLLPVLRGVHGRSSSKPLAIIAVTTKGKGVSFMENKPIWHYRIPSGNELKIALKEMFLTEKDVNYWKGDLS
ncbi:MAG: transketolase [Candidatus Omnitrophica bacterium]|nr:transketolase [Candidatus Omnitrophota bacterium]